MIRQVAIGASLFAVACSSHPAPRSGNDADKVNVGYGTQDRSEVAGSVATVSREDIERAKVTRLEDLFRGRIPGVHVVRRANGEFTIRMRGPTTLDGRDDALIVLDGVPLPDGTSGMALASINPNDVARIDVLKDAGSTAIYGSRGANGVVIINTRRGPDQ
ncbi:MAG TPA: TonB-dependent receptor plug domain-containing protein [Longimicrobiales bacterium]